MTTWTYAYSQSAKGTGGTLKCTSTLTSIYDISQTDDNYTITQSSHTYSTPVYTGTTGHAVSDELFKIAFEATCRAGLMFIGESTQEVGDSLTVSKTHSIQQAQLMLGDAKRDITIPTKTTYAVVFDSNSGDGTPAQQTKWYNEALALTAQTPTKDGYKFIGWATSTARASSGNVDYLAGGSIPANMNEAMTLYAVWELAYTKPIIDENTLVIERCLSDGTLDDEGTYALVEFDWSVYRNANARFYGGSDTPYANNSSSVVIEVGTYSVTATSSDASGTYSEVIGGGNLSTDSQYAVTITLTDTEVIQIDKSVVVLGNLSTSEFPMDFNSTGTAVGIFMPAPDNEEGIFLGKSLTVKDKKNLSRALFDFVRPVGSAYSTIDPSFDPNDVWGGTWAKLPEGYILLSGSESGSYQVGIDTTTSGYKEYGANDKRIEDANIAHGHGFTQPTITSEYLDNVKYTTGGGSPRPSTNGTKTTTGWNKASGGAVHNLGTPSQRQNFNVMQKSIAVYWWIRTA